VPVRLPLVGDAPERERPIERDLHARVHVLGATPTDVPRPLAEALAAALGLPVVSRDDDPPDAPFVYLGDALIDADFRILVAATHRARWSITARRLPVDLVLPRIRETLVAPLARALRR